MHIKNFDPYDFSLKNVDGVPVYYKNLPWSPCIHIRIMFKTGALNDPVGLEGTAHFLEHMIFDGCPSLPDKKEIREFGKIYTINSLNARTSHYSTIYTAKCLPENFEKVLAGMKDMIFNPFLRAEDVEHERSVISQEAWGRYKNEKFLKYTKDYLSNIYHNHDFSRVGSPLGWPDTIKTISQQNLIDFHKNKYVKDNLVIIIVGAIEKKEMPLIQKFIKNLPAGKKVKTKIGKIGKPTTQRFIKTGDDIGDPKEQLTFSIERSGDKLSEYEQVVAMHTIQLLQDLLHEKLRIEHSLCYGVNSSWQNKVNNYTVGIEVKTSEDKKDLVEKEIWKIIDEIKTGKHEKRFGLVHKIRLEWFRSAERLSGEVADYACGEISRKNSITSLKKFLKEEESVTYKDVAKLIKKTFDPNFTYTEIILPNKNKLK